MFSFNNRMSGHEPHRARKFSTMSNSKPLFNTHMSSSTNFFNNIDLRSIQSQKKFVNPNFVNKDNPNIHSCPPKINLHPYGRLSDICAEFSVGINNGNTMPPKSFSTEQIVMKESTQRSKEHTRVPSQNYKKSRDHYRSPRKAHKNKMNIDIKYEIDEVGVDVLSDQFESDSNSNTPTVDIQIPPVFIHEALPEFEIKSDACKISSSPICIAISSPEQMPTVVVSITENISRRRRLSSDCSEDSFIVFQCGSMDDTMSSCESDTDTDDEDSDSTYSDDEYEEDISIKTDTEKSKDTTNKVIKKVTFANDLCKVYPMISWSFAYQEARKGPWEQCARDRGRFKDRINRTEEILKPILQSDHRRRIYHERYMQQQVN